MRSLANKRGSEKEREREWRAWAEYPSAFHKSFWNYDFILCASLVRIFYTQFIWLFMYLSQIPIERERKGNGGLSARRCAVSRRSGGSASARFSLSFFIFSIAFCSFFSFFSTATFLYAYFLWVFNCVELRGGTTIKRYVCVSVCEWVHSLQMQMQNSCLRKMKLC